MQNTPIENIKPANYDKKFENKPAIKNYMKFSEDGKYLLFVREETIFFNMKYLTTVIDRKFRKEPNHV